MSHLQIFPFEKGAHFGFSRQDRGNQFSRDLLLRLVLMGNVPFLKTQLALTAEEQHELNHDGSREGKRADNSRTGDDEDDDEDDERAMKSVNK